MSGSNKTARCECYDSGCRDGAHKQGRCDTTERLQTLRRVDMDDTTGTRFCDACATDAVESGLFDA